MKRVLRTVMMALLVMVMFVGLMAPTAQAAESTLTVTIPVTVTVSGSEPIDNAYAAFQLTPLTENAPMPDVFGDFYGSPLIKNLVKGDNDFSFSWDFDAMGVYEYILQMTDGTYFIPGTDDSVYHIVVYSLAGNEDQVFIYAEDGKKIDALAYSIPLMDLSVAKKWVDKDSTRPGSVEIKLLCDNKEAYADIYNASSGISGYWYPNLTLNKANEWQGTWNGLDSRKGNWTVKEAKVPSGYTATYKYADGVWTVTNTGSLLQTGQLNWPIPVLCIAGVSVLAMGLYLMFARKKENDA